MNQLTTKVSGLARAGFMKCKAHSPEILLATGIVSVVAGVVFAVKETMKVDEILDEAQAKKDEIKQIEEAGGVETEDGTQLTYSHQDAVKDKAILYSKTGLKLIGNYWPTVACTVGGIACILGSYGIMKKRSATLLAAYGALETSFKKYRSKVLETLGPDKEREMRLGKPKKIDVITKDTEGNEVTKKELAYDKDQMATDAAMASPYSKFFDELSSEWKHDPELNWFFLEQQEKWFTHLLKTREDGVVLLNEVYEALDIPRTSTGAVCGWVRGAGDDYVDFGIHNVDRNSIRQFKNGRECSILLDFNCDGLIVDKL